MSLKCQNLDCSDWIEFECSCDRKLQLCGYHFSKHKEISGCFGTSLANELGYRVFKLQQACEKLKEVRKKTVFIVAKMMEQLETMLRGVVRDIKRKEKTLRKIMTEGIEADIDSVMGQYKFTSFRTKNIDEFLDLTKEMLNKHFSADTGEDARYREIKFDDEVICNDK